MKQVSMQNYPRPACSKFVPLGLIGLVVACSMTQTIVAEPFRVDVGTSKSTTLLPTTLLSTEPSLTESLLTSQPASVVDSSTPSERHTVPQCYTVSKRHTITMPASLSRDLESDRFFLINTRGITSNSCRADLRSPNLRINRLDRCGRRSPSDLNDYLTSMSADRPRIIYIHGNRRDAATAISQGLWVYRELARRRPGGQAFDWVIWSWPSESETIFLSDAREKAKRTDAQALYLAWLLNHHHASGQPTSLIGFSFGGRVVTGAMHALAGGVVGRRKLEQPAIVGANMDVGLLAPAVDSTWISSCGRHRLATQNMNRLVLLYNHRDYALKYFRLISQVPGSQALGYTGPRSIAPRYDGTRLPIRSKDCANTVGNHHSEKQYYQNACYAGREMASLIESAMVVN